MLMMRLRSSVTSNHDSQAVFVPADTLFRADLW